MVVLLILAVAFVMLLWLRSWLRSGGSIRQDGSGLEIKTPFLSMNVKPAHGDPSQLGLPLYPGAQLVADNYYEIKIGSIHQITVVEETADSCDQAIAHYCSWMPALREDDRDGAGRFFVADTPEGLLELHFYRHGSMTRIDISRFVGRKMSDGPTAQFKARANAAATQRFS